MKKPTKTIKTTEVIPCPDCEFGLFGPVEGEACERCDGTGEIEFVRELPAHIAADDHPHR